MNILLLTGGLILILIGANALTDGASAIAKRFNISSLVIGLTIVAFGTSAPELAVSLISALKGNSDIAIGNVVGSNIFNTFMIVGCTAVIVPITISKSTLYKEIPLCILMSIVLFICANDILINGEAINSISKSDGYILLAFFLIFMAYTFTLAKNGTTENEPQIKKMDVWHSLLYVVVGLAALIYGGNIFVDGASAIARNLGISEAVIGITLVAGGTSLPELATSVVAALKKNPDMAIGNVIDSNLFNILLVLGVSASITPINIQGITNLDFGMVIFSSVLLFIFGYLFKKQVIGRTEGTIMIFLNIAYMVYLIYKGQKSIRYPANRLDILYL
ncbi:MAG: calcium/sodium antiporter [Tannerellaceae bacterium]|nr:calcium/sodium antiporter [Tannerellaceae bacterium]